MYSSTLNAIRQYRLPVPPFLAQVGPTAALVAIIGVELAVLVTFLPETLRMWWYADSTGDFGAFYRAAEELRPNGLYSPALSLFIYPLTWLSFENAYRVYLALGAVSMVAIAYLGQRAVRSPEARIAIALGVLSIPQLHWALRLGHMTPMLALVALGGFLLLRRHPILAGVCFALLVLKPQYAPIPALYLLWTRNGKALAAMLLGALGLELVGFAAAGFGAIGPYLSGFFDWGADARDNLLPHQQSWQYAWQGFLISIGRAPNPLIAFDLMVLSLAIVMLAWAKTGRPVALVVAALGMLIVTPYANFYDWGLLVVAGALLLRAKLPWAGAAPVMLVALYALLLLSQQATPFPAVNVEVGGLGPSGELLISPLSQTEGIYWVTPAALAVVGLLALMGGRIGRMRAKAAADAGRERPRRDAIAIVAALRSQLVGAMRPAGRLALAAGLVPLAYFAAAYAGHAPPFTETYDPFAPSEVLSQLPEDFPLPDGTKLRDAGKGDELPYRVEWVSEEPVSEVAGVYRELLANDEWELMLEEETSPSYRIRLAHITPYGFMTHWGMLSVTAEGPNSRIILDFFSTRKLTLALNPPDDAQ